MKPPLRYDISSRDDYVEIMGDIEIQDRNIINGCGIFVSKREVIVGPVSPKFSCFVCGYTVPAEQHKSRMNFFCTCGRWWEIYAAAATCDENTSLEITEWLQNANFKDGKTWSDILSEAASFWKGRTR